MRFIFYLFSAVLLLTHGCASVEPSLLGPSSGPPEQLYDGPTLNDDQVAIIIGKHYGSYSIKGRTFKFSDVAVVPGDYRIRAAYIKGSVGYSLGWVDLPITVSAGKTYEIKKLRIIKTKSQDNPAGAFVSGFKRGMNVGDKAVFIWVEDALSGDVVGGYKPTEVSNKMYKVDFTKGFDGR